MTSLLLDTHTMLWFFWDDARLSPAAKGLIEDGDNRKLVSIASCWEIASRLGSASWILASQAVRFSLVKSHAIILSCCPSVSIMQQWSKSWPHITETLSIVC